MGLCEANFIKLYKVKRGQHWTVGNLGRSKGKFETVADEISGVKNPRCKSKVG